MINIIKIEGHGFFVRITILYFDNIALNKIILNKMLTIIFVD